MDKVLIDRELLAGLVSNDRETRLDAERRMYGVLANQPAEAEGVERWSELEKLAEKATPGPWVPFCKPSVQAVFGPNGPQPDSKGTVVNWPGFDSSDATSSQRKANAKFIAAANPATVLSLITALSAVTAERDRLHARVMQLEQFNKSLNDENTRLFTDYCAADNESVTLRAELEMLRDNNRKAAISDAAMAAKEA